MLNLILAVLVPFLVTTAEEQTVSNIEVVEIFRAETTEELEAALTDGYPMPWLEEILNDESIPEEDRYWLDCRVRAAIARDLNLFYDRDGNPVYIEADYMHPGEDYWREHFIINLPGDSYRYDSPELPTRITDQPGYIVNLYGEQVGDIALSRCRIWLARDASVGIGITDFSSSGRRANSACFLYPDGSFIEREIDPIFVQYALSDDGSIAVYYSASKHSPDSEERMLYAFDRNGNLIFQRLMPTGPMSGSATPAVSPDNRFIAVPIAGSMVWLLDASTGDKLFQWGGGASDNPEEFRFGHQLTFSQDSHYLCASGFDASVYDCESGEEVFGVPSIVNNQQVLRRYERIEYARIDNQASVIGYLRKIRIVNTDGISNYEFQYEVVNTSSGAPLLHGDSFPYFSPNGVFLLMDNYESHYFSSSYCGDTSMPLAVVDMREVQQ